MAEYDIVDVTPANLERYDLFCKKSKPKEVGYQQKSVWFRDRFAEGLRIKLLRVDEGKKDLVSRGFIEYVPAEYGWRVVNADGYMLIHCIWVVGRNKKKGYGTELLQACIEDARQSGMKGVAVVASKGNWLPGPELFAKHGFELVDTAPPVFELKVRRFNDAPDPYFPTDWDARLARYGKGLTIVRSHQCPYIDDATDIILDAAEELCMESKVVELATSSQVQERSPSVYGAFNVVYDGKLVSYCWLSKKDAPRVLKELRG